jgi:hypothetical protein
MQCKEASLVTFHEKTSVDTYGSSCIYWVLHLRGLGWTRSTEVLFVRQLLEGKQQQKEGGNV